MRALQLFDSRTKKRPSLRAAFGFGLLVAVCGLALGGIQGVRQVSAADCDSNAIIYCGTGSASQFIAQVRANDSKNGHHDLQAVYAHYGLVPADYDQFVKTARPATLYKDGRLVVDNQVVAGTNTTTIGRNASAQGPGYFSLPIGSTTYYGNTAGATFAAGTDSIGAMAMFDAKGVLKFAVLTSCGNPIGNTPTVPNYACNSLQKTPIAGVANGYNFSTSASAGNGASIAKVVYSFGDGSSDVSETNPNTIVKHTYTKAGTWQAKVTVYVNLPGAQQATIVPAGDCVKTVVVVTPFYNCAALAAVVPDSRNPYGYRFNTTISYGNGATFKNIVYNFGDGTSTTETTATTLPTHTYTKGGNWVATATLTVNLPGGGTASDSSGCKVTAPTPISVATCSGLNTPLVDASNKYKYTFTASATSKNGASIVKYVYNFGDNGTQTVTTASTSSSAAHTYTKAGNYTAKVTVYYTKKGETTQIAATSAACQQKFTVVNPYYSCVQLAGTFVDKSKYIVQLVATGNFGNGATLVSADFTYGDGTLVNGVKATGNTVTVTHTYAGAGNYDAMAVLHFTLNGSSVTAPTCKALISPTAPPTPECKPGVPVGDVRCSPCHYDSSVPSDSPKCVAPLPTTLPDTGAGNVVAIGAVVAVGGFLIYRQLLFRGHKAAFMAADRGTSPLPLAQPLDPETPLAGTPLASKVRKTFRRNRPY